MNSSFFVLLLVLTTVNFCCAETHEYDWTIRWHWAGPDGYWRPVIHINEQFPGPMINITEGDDVIVRVKNYLWTETTSVHWHGLFLNGFPDMDGSPSKNS